MDDLTKLRNQIDLIDTKLMQLLDERLQVVCKVGEVKRQLSTTVLDRSREVEILEKISQFEHQAELTKIYQYIMDISKEIQV